MRDDRSVYNWVERLVVQDIGGFGLRRIRLDQVFEKIYGN